jgi:hypothetical protein
MACPEHTVLHRGMSNRCAVNLGSGLVLLCHKLRRERPFVFAPQHGQRDKMATSLAMSRRRKVEIELGT